MQLAITSAAHPTVILAVLVVLALITAIEPRVVPRGQWLVVVRAGRVHRVHAAGLVARIPLVEQYVWLPRAYARRQFVVSALTNDGRDVRIGAEIGLRIVEPARAAAHTDSPMDAALDEAERALAETVARYDVEHLTKLPGFLDLAIDVPGVEATSVAVEDIEVALRHVAHQTK
ncbi:SPFH domain-containing protein [Kribbella sp. NPDC048915]|uniref:SPFH domain-containing protein n=1 Tax=Kribbella sp. NPDC048915 TaxID=3155148 RepID=UPI0033D00887